MLRSLLKFMVFIFGEEDKKKLSKFPRFGYGFSLVFVGLINLYRSTVNDALLTRMECREWWRIHS